MKIFLIKTSISFEWSICDQKNNPRRMVNAMVVLIFKRYPKTLIPSCWLHAAEQYLVRESAFAPSLTGEISAGWAPLTPAST
jgi:hypothetical protein